MSQALDDLQVGWDARLEYWGDDFVLVGRSTGDVTFRAIILPLDTIDPDTLVPDKRERDQMQVLRAGMLEFAQGDIVKRGAARWKILSRINTNSDFIAMFELVKITPFDT